MQRIYLENRPQKEFRSQDSELHHQLSRVLRARVGDRVVFFGGQWSCEYEIMEITKKEIVFVWKKDTSVVAEERTISLFQALPNKLEKIEYLVQKGVEVGITKFIFFRAQRSQPISIVEKKFDRIRQIAKEALEQSGGFVLPEISIVENISTLLPSVDALAIFHTQEDARTKTIRAFSDSLGKNDHIGMLVGPEGGFSSEEIEEYIALGAVPVSLGQRILRTETAWVVAGFMLLR